MKKVLIMVLVLVLFSLLSASLLAQDNRARVLVLGVGEMEDGYRQGTQRAISNVETALSGRLKNKLMSIKEFNFVADNNKLDVIIGKQNILQKYDDNAIVEYGKQKGCELVLIPTVTENRVTQGNQTVRIVGIGAGEVSNTYTLSLSLDFYNLKTQEVLTSIHHTSTKKLTGVTISDGRSQQSGTVKGQESALDDLCEELVVKCVDELRHQLLGTFTVSAYLAKGVKKIAVGEHIMTDYGSSSNIGMDDVATLYYLDEDGMNTEIGEVTVVSVNDNKAKLKISTMNTDAKISTKSKLTITFVQGGILDRFYDEANEM